MKVAMLLNCGSFEGFFGRILGQTPQSYLESYRGDWAWYYARGLLENGIEPTLYIPSLREAGRYETDTGVAVRFLPVASWYKPLENVWLKRLSRRTALSLYADERLNTVAFMKPLLQGLAEDGVDLLYLQEYWNGRFDHVTPRVSLPVAAADHGGVSMGVLKYWKADAFQRAAVVYCQTEDECGIAGKYGARFRLQPNGCDVSQFCPDLGVERGRTVLTVARLTNRHKRTSDLIRAMTLLPEAWSLDVVGAGPDMTMLRRLAGDLGVSARVRFHGFVGRDEVRKLLQRCGVYAMPSVNEAVALAALEAMACGAAVVLSRIRAFEQLVDDGVDGRLVPVGNVGALASGILEAWEKRDNWGAAATQTVRRQYDARVLYSELAQSLRDAAGQPTEAATT